MLNDRENISLLNFIVLRRQPDRRRTLKPRIAPRNTLPDCAEWGDDFIRAEFCSRCRCHLRGAGAQFVIG